MSTQQTDPREQCEHCGETGGHTHRECPGWAHDFQTTGRASVIHGTETRDGQHRPPTERPTVSAQPRRQPQTEPHPCHGGGYCTATITEQLAPGDDWPTAHNLDGTPHTCPPRPTPVTVGSSPGYRWEDTPNPTNC